MTATDGRLGAAPPFRAGLTQMVRARFPFLYVQTHEEERVLRELLVVAQDKEAFKRPRRVLDWSMARGLREVGRASLPNTAEPLALLDAIEQYEGAAIFLVRDFHWYLRPGRSQADQTIIRRIRELGPVLNRGSDPKTVVLVAPTLVLPDDLQKDVTVVDFDLPSETEIRATLRQIIDDQRGGRIRIDLGREDEEVLVKAALGLTLQEADNAFARAMAQNDRLDGSSVSVVLEEKRQAIRKTEILEYVDSGQDFDAIGGLEYLKGWLEKRRGSWLDAARRYRLPYPKGILITGVPGCGKSLTAKCTSTFWQMPLLRLDVGRIFAGLVGSSEQNMRTAIAVAESIAPSILWIDEIEKGFSHNTGGNLDSGVSSRVFGTFLTWMQEKRKFVFVIATANNIAALPPEFLRKGRFDEIFFVDLPTRTERQNIFRIHLQSRLTDQGVRGDFPLTDALYGQLAERSEGFTGAEIEESVNAALFEAYVADRALRPADVEYALGSTVPLSRTQAEQIRGIREWANTRAVAASAHDDLVGYHSSPAKDGDVPVRGGRRIGL